MRRLAVAGIAAVWLSALGSVPLSSAIPVASAGTGVAAAEEHRAAVIVDTGTQVKSVCVRFREDSLSGVEALTRAQLDPVFQVFSGKGAAVCALCGVGCPAGGSCLTCEAEGRFWSYSRAPAGTVGLQTQGVGASSTTVRDGDVEGWKWALGGTPPFATVEQVCGEAVPVDPTTTVAVPTAPVTTAPAAPGGATTTPRAAGATTTIRPPIRPTVPGPVSTPTAPDGSGAPVAEGAGPQAPAASAPAVGGDATSQARRRSASAPGSAGRGGDSGGGWPELAAFAATLAGLVAWAARARRVRRRTTREVPSP